MKLPTNTIKLTVKIDQDSDSFDINVAHNLSSTMTEEQSMYYQDVIYGLLSKLKTEMTSFAFHGSLLREISVLRDFIDEEEDDDFSVGFEPDEELLEAIDSKKSSKVIKFKKPKLH